MEWTQIIIVALGATGFWKLIEVLIASIQERKIKKATADNLEAQTEVQIVSNWIQWSQHLEQRVKELEDVAKENKRLTKMVEKQRDRIGHLESQVKELNEKNILLKNQLAKLTGSKGK